MKLRISLLLVVALWTGACQKRSRLSPTVLTPPTPEKPARVAQKPQSKPAVAAAKTAGAPVSSTGTPVTSKTSAAAPYSSGSGKSVSTAGVSGPSYSGSAPLSPYPVTVSTAPKSSAASSSTPAPSSVASKPASSKTVRTKANGSSKLASAKPVKVDEKLSHEVQLENRKNAASVRRSEAKILAEASLEAGRQLLREEQHESALKAFREAVRLNSNSAEAWMGIAFVSERNGNMKTAVEAFKEAKKLWGM